MVFMFHKKTITLLNVTTLLYFINIEPNKIFLINKSNKQIFYKKLPSFAHMYLESLSIRKF